MTRHTGACPATLGALAAALLAVACNGERAFAPGVDPNAPVPGGYTADELAYFDEITGANSPGVTVTKWRQDIRVAVSGNATPVDLANIDHVCAELTAAIGGRIRVARDTAGTANVSLIIGPHGLVSNWDYFSPSGTLAGYADVDRDSAGYLDTATVLVDDALEYGYRNEVIRHELTHAVGLLGHTRRFPNSTMTPVANGARDYDPIDLAGIEMLYRDEVQVGMTSFGAKGALHALRRR